jgi:type III secretion protein U
MADEKTEEPSERKIEKAHEDGNFPKSQEFCSALIFAAVLMMLSSGGAMLLDQFRALIRIGLDFGPNDLSVEEIWVKIGVIFTSAVWLIAPVTIVAAVAGTIGMVAQVGFQVSFKPLTPNLENISPAKGIKKIFSIKAVLELLQMMIRAVIIGAVAWQLIRGAITLFAGAGYQTVAVIGTVAWNLVFRLLEFSLLCFLIMSGADYAIQRWQFMKGQRMSKDEVKREYKESEGDPMIKSARMQMARENAQSAPRRGPGIEHAKVILTNPTHYAVAIAYEPGVYDVPVVVARGADEDARVIRERAAALGIPIFSNPPLARALYRTAVNSQIPKEFYVVVAAVLVWLQRLEKLKGARSVLPPTSGLLA